jgi:hypothetical protein
VLYVFGWESSKRFIIYMVVVVRCPFKIDDYSEHVYSGKFHYSDLKPDKDGYIVYSACDMRGYVPCVGEDKCPIMKK